MNVLLVTTANNLAEKLNALNPELEYAAIVTDDIETAKKTLAQVGLDKCFVSSMDELIRCVEYLWYDYIICVQDYFYDQQINRLEGLPVEKIICFAELQTEKNFQTERVLRYYQEHVQDFEMFATGISYIWDGLDITQFKRKLLNFAKQSQDLYYDFNIAKSVILCGEGHNKLRYALIGLAPYIFHYDLSSTQYVQVAILRQFIAFKDLHNFHMSTDVYEKFFRKEWLNKKLPLESVDPNNLLEAKVNRSMTKEEIASNIAISPWAGKSYPETRNENIKILDDYLTLCEENNIRPVMFTIPVTEKHMGVFNKQMLAEFYVLVGQALSKHPAARFFDDYNLQGFTYADFFDHTHLNAYGAAKFNTYLNDFIKQLDNGG